MYATLYSKNACSYCDKVRGVLESNEVEFNEYKLGVDVTKGEVEDILGKSIQTVPQVVIDGRHIGGYDDVCDYFDDASNLFD